MKSSLLDGITILDFSHRLPGPLAGHVLAQMGAKVIKIEDQRFKDAFIHGLFANMDESFPKWYEELNAPKEILRLDFKADNAATKVKEFVDSAQGIIYGPPPKVCTHLGIDQESIKNLGRPFVAIDIQSSTTIKESMHDLNCLAHSGLLKLYMADKTGEIVDPPFMPMGGIAVGHQAACDFLGALLKARSENAPVFHSTYLHDVTESLFGNFWPQELRDKQNYKFLHNGLYPCYSIYQTKDSKYVALACVEEKFWLGFVDTFNLNLTPEDRFFHDSDRVFQSISQSLLQLTQQEIIDKTKGLDLCVTPI